MKGKYPVAFGVSERIVNFAKKLRAKSWHDWHNGDLLASILHQINNTNKKIHFDLTVPLKTGGTTRITKADALLEAGKTGYERSSAIRFTNWELYQIMSNPAALKRTTFWYNGIKTTLK